jgi:hypothetical protein
MPYTVLISQTLSMRKFMPYLVTVLRKIIDVD